MHSEKEKRLHEDFSNIIAKFVELLSIDEKNQCNVYLIIVSLYDLATDCVSVLSSIRSKSPLETDTDLK